MRIAVFVMQKDEDQLLPAWVRYHGTLFGYQNLFIYDNGSTSKENLHQLTSAQNAGCNVIREFTTANDFDDKGSILSAKMNELMSDYDFFVPSDVDELLTLYNGNPLQATQEEIFAEFARLATLDEQYIRINYAYNNISYSNFVRPGYTRKVLVRPGNPIYLDGGYHLWDWPNGMDLTPTGTTAASQFAHVHFHNRDYSALLTSARAKLKNRVPSFRASVLERGNVNGSHVLPYFGMDPTEYQRAGLDIEHAIDISGIWSDLELGQIPFAKQHPIDFRVVDDLLSPVNPYYVRNKGTMSIEEINFFMNKLKPYIQIVQLSCPTTAFLACELGYESVRLIEPDIHAIQTIISDRDFLAYTIIGRLKIENPFTVDLRFGNAPRQHVPQSQIDGFIDLFSQSGRTATVAAGSLKFVASCARLYLGADDGPVLLVIETPGDEAQVYSLFDVTARAGSVVELRPRSECKPLAERLIADFREKYTRPPT